jgi:hypothetical protein
MKGFHILSSSLLTIGLAIVSPVALAGEVAAVSSMDSSREIKPFNLVHRAYSGHFTEQDIPGFHRLAVAYNSGQIKAEDLVQTAIDQGRLSPDKLDDEGYLHTVRYQLRHLETRDSNTGR